MKLWDWLKAGVGFTFGVNIASGVADAFTEMYEGYKKSKGETETGSEAKESAGEES